MGVERLMFIAFGQKINLNMPAMKRDTSFQVKAPSLLSPLTVDTVSFGKTNSTMNGEAKVAVIKDFLSNIYNNWQDAKILPELQLKKTNYKQYGLEIAGQKYLFKNGYKLNNEYFTVENQTTGEKCTQSSAETHDIKNICYVSKTEEFSLKGNSKKDELIQRLKSMFEIIYVISLQTSQGVDPGRVKAFIDFVGSNPFKE